MKTIPILPLLGFLAAGLGRGTPVWAASVPIPDPPVLEASYLGGTGQGYTVDGAVALVRLPDGSRILGAQTTSSTFPGARMIGGGGGRGALVARFPSGGTRPDWVSVVGGIQVWSLTAGADGAVFLTGHAEPGLPYASTAQASPGGGTDAFVAKLRSDGSGLEYFTYLGGASFDVGLGIAVDSSGRAVVGGVTASPDFPTRPGAVQASPGGRFDGFLTRIAADGSRMEFSTRFGGSGSDRIAGVALDALGRIVVVGRTTSPQFPGVGDEVRFGTDFERTDAFVARFSEDGGTLQRVARLGGTGSEGAARVAVQPDGGIVILGVTESADWPVVGPDPGLPRGGNGDLFLARLAPDLGTLDASVVFGSTSPETVERVDYFGGFDVDGETAGNSLLEVEAAGLGVAADGEILVSATTRTAVWEGLRTGGGNAEVVAARFSADLGTIRWMAVLGGREDDAGGGIVDDGLGGAWLAGEAGRPLFPPFFPTAGASAQTEYGGGITDAVLVRLGAPVSVPTNDAFGAATALVGHRVTVRAGLSGATTEPGEPVPDTVSGPRSAWWNWTAPAGGWLQVSLSAESSDATWSVYRGDSLSTLALVGRGGGPGEGGSARLPVVAGSTYRIQVVRGSSRPADVEWSLRLASVANDDFVDRTPIAGLPLDLVGNTTGATVESGEERAGDGTLGGGSVWYEWTATETRAVELLLGGSLFLPALDVVAGDTLGNLVRIQSASGAAGNGGEFQRSVTFLATAGRKYVFHVDGYMGVTGPFQLGIRAGNPPANDTFSARTRLEGVYASQAGTSLRSTFELDSGEPPLVVTNIVGDPGPPPAFNTVWYGWRAPETGRTRVVVTNVTFDTRVAVYRGDSVGTLRWVAADEGRDGGDDTSRAVFEAESGVDYAIQVDGGNYGGRSGDFRLLVVLDHPPRVVSGTVRRNPEGSLEFGVETVPGRELWVEASPDLRTWTRIATSTPEEPRSSVRVPDAPDAFRFYRLGAPEGP